MKIKKTTAKARIPAAKKFEQGSLIQDGDTSVWGLVIWLGTKDENEALEKLKFIAELYNAGEKVKATALKMTAKTKGKQNEKDR